MGTVLIQSPSIPVTQPPFVFVSVHNVIGIQLNPSVVQRGDIYLHSLSVLNCIDLHEVN